MATVQSQIDRVIWGGWRCVGGVLGESVEVCWGRVWRCIQGGNVEVCWGRGGGGVLRETVRWCVEGESEVVCWWREWVGVLRERVRRCTEGQSEVVCWGREWGGVLRERVRRCVEGESEVVCWGREWGGVLREERVRWFEEGRGKQLGGVTNTAAMTTVLWPHLQKQLVFCDPLDWFDEVGVQGEGLG